MNGQPFFTKKDYLVETIREKILSGEIRPGDRLLQRDLAEQFETSVTPVREALRQLESEGIITYSPYRGARVVTISPQDAVEICLIRVAVEGLALELAFPHLTHDKIETLWEIQSRIEEALDRKELALIRSLNRRFHTQVIGYAQSPQVTEVAEYVWAKLPWNVLPAYYAGVDNVIYQHHDILEALERRDLAAALQANREHIMNWGYFLKDYLEERVAYEGLHT